MSDHFPLYENICTNISNKDLTTKQKHECMSLLQNIDQFGMECIYALIHYHYMNEGDSSESSPYQSVVETDVCGKSIVTCNLNDFPNKLKQILLKFVNMHTESTKEKYN